MNQRDREREIRRRLYEYASYKKDIDEYVDSIINSTPSFDESGVRGTAVSDPTARAGVALANMPRDLETKQQWVEAIEEALAELQELDGSDTHGYVYICVRVFGMQRRHKKKKNREVAIKVAMDCNMALSTLYNRLAVVTKIVLFHATKRGLLK